MILPPASSTNFTKVIFNLPNKANLLSTYQWSLTGIYGINYAANNVSEGVQIQIVAAGDPIDPSDPPWAVIDSFTILQSGAFYHSTPLGTWPLKNGFNIAIQVSAIGSTNFDDNLVIDGLAISPNAVRPTLGIAQSDLVWNTNPMPTVSGIANLGSTWLRTNMRATSLASTFAGIVVAANHANQHVIAQILVDPDDFDNPAGSTANNTTAFTQLCGYSGGALRVSQTNVALFTRRFTSYLKSLKAAGAIVEAFEIGNEYDWACFNGDIPLGGSAIKAASLTPFIQKYALLVKAAKQVMTTYYPQSQLITFGAANCFMFVTTSCVQDPQNLLAALQNINGLNYLDFVDGFGEHLYPSPTDIPSALTALQNISKVLGVTKPFWITEWGFNNTSGQSRYLEFRQFLELMNSTGSIPVAHLMLYNYASADSWSLLSGGATGSVDAEARIFPQYNPLLGP